MLVVVASSSLLPQVGADLLPFIIAAISAIGVAIAKIASVIIHAIENERDRRLYKHLADKHGPREGEAVAKAIARTRWRRWRQREDPGSSSVTERTTGNVLERGDPDQDRRSQDREDDPP